MDDITFSSKLPPHIEKTRTYVECSFKKIHNPIGSYGARTFAPLGFDNSLDLDEFRASCGVSVTRCIPQEAVFDMYNVDTPIANALRRIMLVEVPSMAIEIVRFHDNTSIMHDEMFAHRLGLVPLAIDPRPFDIRQKGDSVSYRNTINFRLNVRCDFKKFAPTDSEAPPGLLYENYKVLSSHIEYVPFPGAETEQAELFGMTTPVPVHDDILLCKLRPGQQIKVEMEATKNIGREHAKWSPVCTVAYRMLPEIRLKESIYESDAQQLVDMCPANVFDIEDGAAVVSRPRDCTLCRECIRLPEWDERVELLRKRNHFIFHVESVGGLPAAAIVSEALSILMKKCDVVLNAVESAAERRGTMAAAEPDEVEDEEEVDMEIGGATPRR